MKLASEETKEQGYLATLLAGSSVIFFGFVIQKVISFGAQIVMARLLGRTGYGAVSIGITIAGTLGTLSLLGVHGGVSRFLPRVSGSGARKGVILSAGHFAIPCSLVMGGVTAVGANYLAQSVFGDSTLIPVIRAFGIAIPFVAFTKFTIGVIQGMEVTKPKVYIQNIIRPTLRFSLVIGALWAGFGRIGVSNGIVVSYALTAGIAAIYLIYKTDLLTTEPAKYIHPKMINYSLPLAVTSGMTIIMSNVDTLFLGWLATTGDVGIYRVVYALSSLLLLFLHSFKFVSMPMLSRADSNDNKHKFNNIYQQMTRWLLVLSFPPFAIMLLYSEQIIGGIYGIEYIPNQPVLAVLAGGFFIHALLGPANSALKAIGRTKLIMILNLVAAVLNLALNYFLIPKFGILGAAIATALSYVSMNALYVGSLLYENVTIFNWRIFSIIPVALISFGTALAISLWGPGFSSLYPLLAFSILYAVGIYLFVITEDELQKMKTTIRSALQ